MRLYNFLSVSDKDQDVAQFRSFSIGLVEEDTDNIDIVKRIVEKYSVKVDLDELLERANKDLKAIYRGRLKFDVCIEDQELKLEELRVDTRKSKKIKERWFKFNDELSEIQNNFEIDLKRYLQK